MSTPERDLEQYERENERADELEHWQDFISDLEDLTNSLRSLIISAPTPSMQKAVQGLHDRTAGLLDAAMAYLE